MKLRIAAVLVSLVTIASVSALTSASAGSGGPSTPVDCRTQVENPCLPQTSEEPKPVVTSSPTELADAAGNTENTPNKTVAVSRPAADPAPPVIAKPATDTSSVSMVEEKASSGCN